MGRPQFVREMLEIGKTVATARRIKPSGEGETLVNGWIVENDDRLFAWSDIASKPTSVRYNGNSNHTYLSFSINVETGASRRLTCVCVRLLNETYKQFAERRWAVAKAIEETDFNLCEGPYRRNAVQFGSAFGTTRGEARSTSHRVMDRPY